MYVRGDQWPIFLYEDGRFDPEDPWKGLLCNQLLVSVCCAPYVVYVLTLNSTGIQTRLYVTKLS
jgi:hypothetical protein